MGRFRVSWNDLKQATSQVSLRAGPVAVQPLEKWIHDLCTAKTLEARAYILMEPFQSSNLKDSVETNIKNKKNKIDSVNPTWFHEKT